MFGEYLYRPSFGPIGSVTVQPPNELDYNHIIASSGNGSAELKIIQSAEMESAPRIDESLDPFTVATLHSIRRLYKLTGSFPPAELITEELNCLDAFDREITEEDVTISLEALSSICSEAMGHAQRQVKFTLKDPRINLSPAEQESIAVEMAMRSVYFRWTIEPQPQGSNGFNLLKLVYRSVNKTIWQRDLLEKAYSVSETIFADINNRNHNDDLASDYMGFIEAIVPGAYAASAEEEFLLREEESQRHYPDIETVNGPINDNGDFIHIRNRINLATANLPLEVIFQAIGNLPRYYQVLVLHYFGYISSGLNREDFTRQIKLTREDCRQGLISFVELLEKPRLIQKVNVALPEMLTFTQEEINRSKNEQRAKYSSLFRLLQLVHNHTEESLKILPDNIQILLQIVLQNIEYSQSGALIRNLAQISQALSVYYGRRMTNALTREIILTTLIPALQKQ